MSATEVTRIRKQAFALAPDEQFRLASFIAANVGYVLTPERGFMDEPTLEDRVAKLEKTMAHICPDKSNDI